MSRPRRQIKSRRLPDRGLGLGAMGKEVGAGTGLHCTKISCTLGRNEYSQISPSALYRLRAIVASSLEIREIISLQNRVLFIKLVVLFLWGFSAMKSAARGTVAPRDCVHFASPAISFALRLCCKSRTSFLNFACKPSPSCQKTFGRIYTREISIDILISRIFFPVQSATMQVCMGNSFPCPSMNT
jgi:hypothetical protein